MAESILAYLILTVAMFYGLAKLGLAIISAEEKRRAAVFILMRRIRMEVLTWAMMTIGSAYGLWLFVLAIADAEEEKRRAGELAWQEWERGR